MATITDKRFVPKQGDIANRQKFIKRYKANIKKAVQKNIADQSIKDFKFKGQKVRVKAVDDDINLPSPSLDPELGIYDGVSVGNKTYEKGDKVAKPSGSGSGSSGSNSGEGEDSFLFELTEQEFQDIFFEDLELPDMKKKNFIGDFFEFQRQGYSTTGGPSSLNVVQTMKRAIGRFLAIVEPKSEDEDPEVIEDNDLFIIEDTDLRYNFRDKVDVPSSKSVMFCLMDVSGSMGRVEKDIAKRFFILLSLFLKRNYTTVDIVFVRHADWAEECDEDTFFYAQEAGGTVISVGYEKVLDIIQQRYDSNTWNIYVAQATDGDNFDYDIPVMTELLTNHLLPLSQYFTFVEICSSRRNGDRSNVYNLLTKISEDHKNLAVTGISDYPEILDAFRGLFSKEKKK